ncbi:unnamed protein product [Toxocara canis]|uniref:TR_THY domain-containing protein n=1 Tax=Toxocara canis TaxID=6265 RepID=A0A183U6R6_TOXCA|nr:unnamed protein product [Toxocara canis]
MKILLLAVVHLLITETSAQATNVISSHVLDISSGRPAVGVHTTAFFLNDHNQWILVGNSLTDSSGRIANVHQGHQLLEGQYQLHFDTGPYFANHGMSTFYPYIKVSKIF